MGNAIDNAAIAQSVRRDGMHLSHTTNGIVGTPMRMGMQNQPHHHQHQHHQHHQHQHQQSQQYPMSGFPQQQQQQYPMQQPQQMTSQMNTNMMGNGMMNSGNVGGSVWSNEVIVGGINTPAPTMQNNPVMHQQPQPVNSSSFMNMPQMYGQQSINGNMNYNNNQMMYPSSSFNQQQPQVLQQQQQQQQPPQQQQAQQLLSQAIYQSAGGNKVNLNYLKMMQAKNSQQQSTQGTMNNAMMYPQQQIYPQQSVYSQQISSIILPQFGQGAMYGQPTGGQMMNGTNASINGMKYSNTNQITSL